MRNRLLLISAAVFGLLSASTYVLSQQSGSGLPGGATYSTQIKNSGTAFGGVGPGTSGHVLTSNGAGMPPSFQAVSAAPGGADTNVQYNNSGAFGGEAAFTYNAGTNTLTADNIVASVSCTGCGSPAGSANYVQYNSGSGFGAEAAFTYNASTNILTADTYRGANGLVSAPTYSFTNDVDTGFFLASAGSWRAVTNGVSIINLLDAAVQFPAAVTMQSTFATEGTAVFDPGSGTDELTITSGSVVTGVKLTTAASATGAAGFNLPHGTAPSSPANGDLWTTTSGLFARINGSTVGPYAAGVAQSTGTFTVTWAQACNTNPTQTWNYTITGDMVAITPTQDVATCTSDSTSFISTGGDIPVAIRQNSATVVVLGMGVPVTNNGTVTGACLRIESDYSLAMSISTNGYCATGNNWTNTGDKAMFNVSGAAGRPTYYYTIDRT